MVEWQGAEYRDVSRLQQWLADESLAALMLDGGERVLDVGCGDGKITAEIAARLPRGSVLGVDPSHDMIAYATRTHGAPNLAFEIGDARTLPYRDAFDLVVSFNALHWVHEQEQALRAIHAALRPGGRALLQMVPRTARTALEDVIEETCRSPRWAAALPDHRPPYLHWEADAYRALAEQAGFRVERIDVVPGTWDFGSREAFTRFAHATFVGWIGALPDADQPAFIADVLDRWGSDVFAFDQMRAALVRG